MGYGQNARCAITWSQFAQAPGRALNMLKHGPVTIERLGTDVRLQLRRRVEGDPDRDRWSIAEIRDLPRTAWVVAEERGIAVTRYDTVEAVLVVVP